MTTSKTDLQPSPVVDPEELPATPATPFVCQLVSPLRIEPENRSLHKGERDKTRRGRDKERRGDTHFGGLRSPRWWEVRGGRTGICPCSTIYRDGAEEKDALSLLFLELYSPLLKWPAEHARDRRLLFAFSRRDQLLCLFPLGQSPSVLLGIPLGQYRCWLQHLAVRLL